MEESLMARLSTRPLSLLLLLLLFCLKASACFNRKPARIISKQTNRWLGWTEWSDCSVSCGQGRKTRHRTCRFGKSCSSPKETEMKLCVNYLCRDDGGMWTSWSPCSSSCGDGWTERSLSCPDPTKECKELRFVKKKCNLGPCPINGSWTAWGRWSDCSATCGAGTASRWRSCTNPAPRFGGAHCREANRASRTCNLNPCHPKVHGQWGSWGSWSSCSATCLEGVKKRQRRCDSPVPAFGGNSCSGKAVEVKPCVVRQFCEPAVDGNWGSWNAWMVCSERCSNGTRSRLRYCNDPKPKFGGKECPGNAVQSEPCIDICAVHGGWSAWKSVGICDSNTRQCSKGWQHQQRTCDNPTPKHGGRTCPGDSMQTIDCWDSRNCATTLQAPADFESLSFENKTVLVTWRERPFGVRPTNFEIRFKRKGASDAESQFVTEPEIPPGSNSPVDGRRYSRLVNLSSLSDTVLLWISSVKIEGSSKSRNSTEPHQLMVGEVDGSWSSWESWGRCSKTCGVGRQIRQRRCDSPTRTANGRKCPGSATERGPCSKGFCPS